MSTVLKAPDDIPDVEGAARLDPEAAVVGRTCEEQHDARACTQAAEYWQGGDGHPFDPTRSFRYASAGCAGGDGLACAVLADHYQKGIGVAWVPRRAIELYERSCDAGIGLGCAALGEIYFAGRGVGADRAKARAYRVRAHEQWLTACLGSEPRWCTYAASSTRDGEPAAQELLRRACDHGVAAGCVRLLEDNLAHATGERAATMREIDGWCNRGTASACRVLAAAYDLPNDSRDPARSVAATRRACVLGDADACVMAGVLHEVATGVPRDDAVARRYFRRACDRGEARRCWYLAQDSFVLGGLERDIAGLAQRGCEVGSPECCELAVRLAVLRHDEPAILRWATVACRLGSGAGCWQLIARGASSTNSMLDPVRLYRGACKANIAAACPQLPGLIQAENDLLRGIVAAADNHDAAAFAKLVANEVELRGLTFDDPDCTRRFSGVVMLTVEQHPAFLRCLARAGVHLNPASDNQSPLSLVYQSGVTVDVATHDGVAWWITSSEPSLSMRHGAVDLDAVPGNVGPTVLEAHRILGDAHIVPDDDIKTAIYAAGSPQLIGSFKLCITAGGAVASVAMLKSTGSAAYDRKIERELFGWKYRLFTVDSVPVPVCTAVTFVYSQH
jgi:TPR repeat protein